MFEIFDPVAGPTSSISARDSFEVSSAAKLSNGRLAKFGVGEDIELDQDRPGSQNARIRPSQDQTANRCLGHMMAPRRGG